jgi:hypothetical protein
VPQKSLKEFSAINKYGFVNLPDEKFRVEKEEFLGTKENS